MKTCNQGILKLCFEVDQKRSKYVWKIFEDLWNTKQLSLHTLALASVRRWLCYETRSAWPQQARRHLIRLIDLDWCCIGAVHGGPVQTHPVIPCPLMSVWAMSLVAWWSLVHRYPSIQGSWMHPKLHGQRCLPHLEDAFFPGFACPNHLSDLNGLMTTTLSGVLMCSFHHGQRWNWIIARRFIQRKAQESHSSHFDVQWCTHSNWHEW